MEEINLEWDDFKTMVTSKNLSIQYNEIDIRYDIFAFDDNLIKYCSVIWKDDYEPYDMSYERDDFINNYKSTSNQKIELNVTDSSFSKTLSYSTFKDKLTTKELEWQFFEETDKYDLFSVDGKIVYQCTLYKSDTTNTDDFETNYKPTANKKIGIALDPLNSPVVSFKGDGAYGSPTKGTTTNIDFQLTTDRYLNGANFYVQNSTMGDYVAFQVVDVDNLLGYGAGLVLSTWVIKWYVPPNTWCMITSPTAGLVNTGFYLRVVYNSVAGVLDPQANLFINYHLNMKL